MSVKKTRQVRKAITVDPEFESIAAAFTKDPQVSHPGGKGFGSGALKVNGKIFAMKSSKGEFVVKLPKERVDELVTSGQGERFDPGHGRLMKEWIALADRKADRVELAREAYDFVKRS